MIWENLREEEFEGAIKKSGGLCILPLGCIEKHGQHLPVGTDYIEAMTVIRAAAEIEDVVIFPSGAWLGEVSCFHAVKNPERDRLLGCIGIKQSTILTVLRELCDEIARNGFRKILIVNCHGGNVAMLKHFIRCQSYESLPYATMSTFALDFRGIEPMALIQAIRTRKDEFSFVTNEDIEVLKRYAKTGYGGGHGDFRESALVMAEHADAVDLSRSGAECGTSNHRTDYLSALGVDCTNIWLANFPNSYEAGSSEGCTATIGRAMVKICAERLAKIFAMLKKDEDCVRIAGMLPKE